MAYKKVTKTNKELEAVKHLYPALKRYEIEARLICSEPFISLKHRYNRYLGSTHWTVTRHKKRYSVGNKCEKCSSTRELHVHHINYKLLYDVTMEDLMVLCEECHKKEHS